MIPRRSSKGLGRKSSTIDADVREDEDGLLAPAEEADLTTCEATGAHKEPHSVHVGRAIAVTGAEEDVRCGGVVDAAKELPFAERFQRGIQRVKKFNLTPGALITGTASEGSRGNHLSARGEDGVKGACGAVGVAVVCAAAVKSAAAIRGRADADLVAIEPPIDVFQFKPVAAIRAGEGEIQGGRASADGRGRNEDPVALGRQRRNHCSRAGHCIPKFIPCDC